MTNCPNCGAPAKGSRCEYCGTPLEDCVDYDALRRPSQAGCFLRMTPERITIYAPGGPAFSLTPTCVEFSEALPAGLTTERR